MRTHQSTSPPLKEPDAQNDALAMLSADHQHVTELFDEFQMAMASMSAEQKSICERICDELTIHSQLEEEIFYPTVSSEAAIKRLVEEALEDHADIKATIEQIRNLQIDDPQLSAHMLQLMGDVERHIDEEENVLFAEVEKRLGDQLKSLGRQLEDRKRELVALLDNAPDEFSKSTLGRIF